MASIWASGQRACLILQRSEFISCFYYVKFVGKEPMTNGKIGRNFGLLSIDSKAQG